MKSLIFVILPMLCTCLAFPVSLVKEDDARSEKERSLEELEEQLEGTQKHADVVKSKIQTQRNTTQVLEKGDHFTGYKSIRREKMAHALQEILIFYARDHGIKVSQAVQLIARVVDLFGQALELSAEEKLDLERRMATEIVGVLQQDDELIEELEKEIKSDIITFNLTGDDIKLFVRLKIEEKAFLHHLSAQEKEKIIKRIIHDLENKEVSPPTLEEIEAMKEGIEEWAKKKGLTKEETQVLETVLIGALEFRSSVKPVHTERFHPTPEGTSPISLPKKPLEIEQETEEQKPVAEEMTPATPTLTVKPTDKEVDQAEAIIVEKPTLTTQTTTSETVEITVEKMESDVKPQVDGKNEQSQDNAESELEDLKSQEDKDTTEKMPADVMAEKMKKEANPRSEGRQEDEEEEKDLEATEGETTQVKSSSAKHETQGKLQPKKAEISPVAKSTEQIDIMEEKSTPQKAAVELHSKVLLKVEKIRPPEAAGKPAPSSKSPSGKITEDKVVIEGPGGKASEGRQMGGEDDDEKDLEALGARTPSRPDEQIQVKVEKLSSKTTETQSVVSPPTKSVRKISVKKITPQKTVEEEQPKVEVKVEEINPPKIIEGPNQQTLEPTNDHFEKTSVKAEKALPETIITNSEISNEEEDLHTERTDADTVLEKKQLLRMEKRSEVVVETSEEKTTDEEKLEAELEKDLPAVSETTDPEEIDKNKLVRDFEEALSKERLASAKSAVQTTSSAPSAKESKMSAAESVQPERKAGEDPEELEEELEKQFDGAKRGREESERKLDALAKDTAEQDMEETLKAVGTQDDKAKDSNSVFVTVEKVPEVPMETIRNKKLLSETGEEEENTADELEYETKQKETLPVVVKVEQVPSGGNEMSMEKASSVEGKTTEANDLVREEEELEKDLEGETKAVDKEPESVSRVKKRVSSKHLEEELEDLLSA